MDKSLILNRIKSEKKFKTDTELANFLGISKATLSNWYKRDTIDYDLVLSKCEHMDLNWIIRGDKSFENSNIPIIDSNSMGFILDRYEALAAKNALLEKTIEDFRFSQGTPPGPFNYNLPSEKIDIHIAAEPVTPKQTR